jgi:thiosulfate/3-mercaptopyruvate sulfurtransferase
MKNEKKINLRARTTMSRALLACASIALSGAYLALLPAHSVLAARAAAIPAPQLQSDPWTAAQTVTPADLVKELATAKAANRPVVVCAGFHVLYYEAHVPGSVFHGPASRPDGLQDLKQWAQAIPRTANLVVYCGCCPAVHCPNIRPAFEALQTMGFKHLRVLVLPTDLAKDWIGAGYATEKGS